MSMGPDTRKLEAALRYLAANNDDKVEAIAARHGVTKQEIWEWLAQHNGGRKQLPAHRIDAVLAKLHVVPAGANARQIGQVAVARAGREKISPAAKKEAAPNAVTPPSKPETKPAPAALPAQVMCAPRKPTALPAIDDGDSPWVKHPKGPWDKALKRYRPLLEKMAAGQVLTAGEKSHDFRQFTVHWFGGLVVHPGRVRRFLAWCDSRGAVEAGAKAIVDAAFAPARSVVPSAPAGDAQAGKRAAEADRQVIGTVGPLQLGATVLTFEISVRLVAAGGAK